MVLRLETTGDLSLQSSEEAVVSLALPSADVFATMGSPYSAGEDHPLVVEVSRLIREEECLQEVDAEAGRVVAVAPLVALPEAHKALLHG